MRHFRDGIAPGGRQRYPQGQLHVELLLDALQGVWEGVEQRQRFLQMTDGFEMGGALYPILTCLIPTIRSSGANSIIRSTKRKG